MPLRRRSITIYSPSAWFAELAFCGNSRGSASHRMSSVGLTMSRASHALGRARGTPPLRRAAGPLRRGGAACLAFKCVRGRQSVALQRVAPGQSRFGSIRVEAFDLRFGTGGRRSLRRSRRASGLLMFAPELASFLRGITNDVLLPPSRRGRQHSNDNNLQRDPAAKYRLRLERWSWGGGSPKHVSSTSASTNGPVARKSCATFRTRPRYQRTVPTR